MIQFPQSPANEADVASGVIRVTVGGQAKTLPTLKIGPFEDEWLPKQGAALAGLFEKDLPVQDLVRSGIGTLLDAVVAYDTTNALGGREFLRSNADHAELHAIARAIYERHFAPFMRDAQTILEAVRRISGQMAATTLAQQIQEKSTNGASPTGGGTRRKSAKR